MNDDLLNDKSYYFDEVLRIKEMLDLSKTNRASLFLLDEISAGLSKKHLEIVINVIKQLAAEGKLIIIADHLDDILKLADKTINLDQHNV